MRKVIKLKVLIKCYTLSNTTQLSKIEVTMRNISNIHESQRPCKLKDIEVAVQTLLERDGPRIKCANVYHSTRFSYDKSIIKMKAKKAISPYLL
jgi:hypothetical protein